MNSISANYKASKKTEIQYKNSTNIQKQNAKQTKQEQCDRKKQYKGSTGTPTLNSAISR
jgi:hypothetical protein